MSNNNMPSEEDSRWADEHWNDLETKLQEARNIAVILSVFAPANMRDLYKKQLKGWKNE